MDEDSFAGLISEVQDADGLVARRRALPTSVQAMHGQILGHFGESGGAPSPEAVRAWATELGLETRKALLALVRVDLVQADAAAAQISTAYPFAAEPRGHQVDLEDGPRIQACCALDALGIAALLDRDVTVISHDPHDGVAIRVEVRGGTASSEPKETVVAIPSGRSQGAQAGDCICPTVNLHSSPASARAHAQTHGLTLELLTLDQGYTLGAAIFGGLLTATADTAAAVDGQAATSDPQGPGLTP